MIQRQSEPFKRFLQGILRWVILIGILVALYTSAGFLAIRATAPTRVITIDRPRDPQAPPTTAPDSLRLCSYNISHGLGSGGGADNPEGGGAVEIRDRLIAIGEALRDQRLDLVVLNEVDFGSRASHGMDQAAIIAEAGNFPYVVKQSNIDSGIPLFYRIRHGNALLSRFPIVNASHIALPTYSELERLTMGNHDAFLAEVQLGKEDMIHVLGLQLDERSEDLRVQCASEIVKQQRELNGSLMVLGDFNSTLPGFPGSKSSANGQNAIELLDSFGNFRRRPVRGRATHHDFTHPSIAPRRIIDWIMPDENWSFMQYGVLQSVVYSEHLPVIAAVRKR